jgi:hypothetical protein
MHKIEIVKKDGKKVTYDLTPSVKVAFETEFKTGWRKRLGELQLESDLWWFAHRLEKEAGKTDLAFGDDYINQYLDVDLVYDSKNG